MSKVRKAMIIVGAPLTLATLLGGAAAFASQSGNGTPDPSAHGSHSGYHRITLGDGTAHGSHGGYHRITSGDGTAHDGSDCPYDKGYSSSDAPVSPAVY